MIRTRPEKLGLLLALLCACTGARSGLTVGSRDPAPTQGSRADTADDTANGKPATQSDPTVLAALLDPDPSDGSFPANVNGKEIRLGVRAPDPGLKVAFLGDQGLGGDGLRVLELVRDEGADFVVHAGDFDYADDPASWDAQITQVLGERYPYFASVGNHDLPAWAGAGGYQERLATRLSKVEGAVCAGDLGVNASCRYRGLFFVLSGVGTLGANHEAYLRAALAGDKSVFRICNWHKNQHDMQVGGKIDEVGWDAYRACQEAGALIVTGHEHSYARTLGLTDLGNHAAAHGATGDPALLLLQPGMTTVIVSGLGGQSHRAFSTDHAEDSWWASIYALDRQMMNGAEVGSTAAIDSGALFIEFNVDGDPRRAHGYFKTIANNIVDRFDLAASDQAAVQR